MTTTKTYAVQIWKDLQLLILNISYANLAVRISDQVSATLTWLSSILNACKGDGTLSAKKS